MHISVNKRYTQKGKKAGVRSEVIKDLMGHSKVATTLIYVHSSRGCAGCGRASFGHELFIGGGPEGSRESGVSF
ncbi:MAG TPA: hypothetical protein VD966_09225 [Pyrinomonadaceae bacterium]|nr:hypothetical protein [Pyrinomonadaceae bacterium]